MRAPTDADVGVSRHQQKTFGYVGEVLSLATSSATKLRAGSVLSRAMWSPIYSKSLSASSLRTTFIATVGPLPSSQISHRLP